MADAAAPSLGDFFKSKGKKKVKASNLNKETATNTEEKAKTKKSAEDDAWEEEQVVATAMKVEVVGKLVREEEKKEDDVAAAPAWGNLKEKGSSKNEINERRFPSLAKSVGSIAMDDGDGKVNIQTTKNHFAALEGAEESDEDSNKRPSVIKPAMVSKKQGEFAKVALQREVDKYSVKKPKKNAKAVPGEVDEDEEEEDAEAEDVVETPAPAEKTRKKKQAEKKDENQNDEKVEKAGPEAALEEDLKIQPDLVASKEKYKGRKKLAPVDLPAQELREEKEIKPKQQSGGKKKKFVVEEETDKKLVYAEW